MDGGDGGFGRREPLALRQLHDAISLLGETTDLPLYGMDGDELMELARKAETVRRLGEVVLSQTARQMDADNVGGSRRGDTGGLLRGLLLMNPGEARTRVELARDLDGGTLPAAVAAAFTAAVISHGHVAVIHRVLGRIHPEVPAEDREMAERYLLAQAQRLDPKALADAGVHLLAVLNPQPDDKEQKARRRLDIFPLEDGMTGLRGVLDPASAAVFTAAAGLGAPAPAADGQPDERTAGQRNLDGVVEALTYAQRHRATGTGGEVPQVSVLAQLSTLLGRRPDFTPSPDGTGMPPAITETGPIILSQDELQSICCDAAIRRIIFDPLGMPINVGRATRTISPQLRAAIVARDLCCTFPGCDRPPSWCSVHHVIHWLHHGETCVGNCILVCTRHHDLIHHGKWEVRIVGGIVEWREPARYRNRQWRSNQHRAPRDPYTAYSILVNGP